MALLRPGGAFVAKLFRSEHAGQVYAKLLMYFKDVLACKPRASRNSSVEIFVVCRGFVGASQVVAAAAENFYDIGTGAASCNVPFIACGGLDALDADTNYAVEENHLVKGPVAPPIH